MLICSLVGVLIIWLVMEERGGKCCRKLMNKTKQLDSFMEMDHKKSQ